MVTGLGFQQIQGMWIRGYQNIKVKKANSNMTVRLAFGWHSQGREVDACTRIDVVDGLGRVVAINLHLDWKAAARARLHMIW